ncbi:hypothetical protein CPB83DRAFT_840887 [Crepidotus variabilis]|uniref:Uncharacterized protein n=1 Tax=Crepidotus variabilis TaxID=179855 RepID=A0A9P6E3P7_9AGAR|nr:hypothetical protein CPB83DRAFT_840887 [Crepidotus variabilis]
MTLDINAIRQVTMLAGIMSNPVIPSKEQFVGKQMTTHAMDLAMRARKNHCFNVCHLDTVECLDVPGVFPNTGDWVAKILEWTGSSLKELRISDPPSSTQLWRNTKSAAGIPTDILHKHSSQDFGSTASNYQPALTKIEFCSPDGPLEEFLALFETPSLQVVKYKPLFGVDSTLMNAIFWASSVLVSIAVTIFDPESMFTPEDTLWSTLKPINDEDVEPLFCLHTLRELRLDGIFTSEMTEEQRRKLRQQNPSDLLQFEALMG